VATAILAGVIAQILVLPPGAWRVFRARCAVAAGLLASVVTRRSILPAWPVAKS
jgi:hypothetical protein